MRTKLLRSLRTRLLVLVGLGMAALAGVLQVSSLWEVRGISDRALNERRRLAEVLAEHLDYVLQLNLSILQGLALEVRAGLPQVNSASLKAALREASLRSIFTAEVFVLDRSGTLIWRDPPRPFDATEDIFSLAPVQVALTSGKPSVSNLIGEEKRRRLYAVVPVRDWNGELAGVVAAEIDPQGPRFRSLLRPVGLGETAYVDLVDSRGIVLASTRAGRIFTATDHGRFLGDLIEKKRSAVGTCHSCHQEQGFSEREREVLAFASLTFAPWGLAIRQAEVETLRPAFTIERRRWLVGALTILVALLFAWGAAASVTRPLALLTRATQRIATGNLDAVVPAQGTDEIGQLARSFDRMRLALKASLEEIAEGKRDLENRVQERTRELQALYQELQRKEELRGELLKKLLTVQDEERKRIARELHDETSQGLAALLLSIEKAIATSPPDLKSLLLRTKAMTNRALDGLHRLIFDLRPSALDDLGLAAAIRWSAENRLEPMGIDLEFEVRGAERRLAPEVETILFRIAQEAVTNIAKHAEAESVRISIDFEGSLVRLRLEDDGKGFDVAKILNTPDGLRGLGLLGMQERAALVEGTLMLDSSPQGGTRLTVEVPVGRGVPTDIEEG